jgi:ATP-binding cassette subfamily B (MDR/TAP) protein 1
VSRPAYDLSPHTSSLPTFFYILSFSPPIPSPFRKPREFIHNPKILYMVGTVAACIAGVGLPAFDIVTGWWTNYVNRDGIPSELVLTRGSQAGWIMTIIGVVYILAFTLFMTCCEYPSHLVTMVYGRRVTRETNVADAQSRWQACSSRVQ